MKNLANMMAIDSSAAKGSRHIVLIRDTILNLHYGIRCRRPVAAARVVPNTYRDQRLQRSTQVREVAMPIDKIAA